MVYVEKGGEIIPKITSVDTSSRHFQARESGKLENLLFDDFENEKVIFIKNCPECGAALVRYEGEAAYYCPNENACQPQIKGKMEHFVSRRAMNIDGLGEETINLLYDNNLLHNIADIYELKANNIVHLERLGDKSARNIIAGIQATKNVPFERVLFALGVRFVGETIAKKLAFAFKNIDELAAADFEKLTAVDEIGERIAQSVIAYFANNENKTIIERLKNFGLQMEISQET
jgi:DNA ligase (NAD+)